MLRPEIDKILTLYVIGEGLSRGNSEIFLFMISDFIRIVIACCVGCSKSS